MTSERLKLIGASLVSALALALGSVAVVSADPPTENPAKTDKVTICHRTNAVTNPYIKESVAADSADGDTGNDNGKGDHSQHTGPVATSQQVAQDLKDNKQNWGDIIPPHDNYGGLNWNSQGQAVYNNGCKYATPGRGGGETPSGGGTVNGANNSVSQGVLGAQVTVPQQGAVAAGGGGGTAVSTAAAVGAGGSLLSIVSGMVLSARRKL